MYLTIRHGIYRHEIVCCTTSLEKARRAAYHALNRESDDYHVFAIVEIPCEVEVEDVSVVELISNSLPHPVHGEIPRDSQVMGQRTVEINDKTFKITFPKGQGGNL